MKYKLTQTKLENLIRESIEEMVKDGEMELDTKGIENVDGFNDEDVKPLYSDVDEVIDECGFKLIGTSDGGTFMRFIVIDGDESTCTFNELFDRVKELYGDKAACGKAYDKYDKTQEYDTIIIKD